ncbi:beta-lactamase/transpeptidase-like protein [Xylariales sp. PMI_506]|nr:beta-lactamase/transpeptidase-like protein [Xylariales sp. PMI_506]
MAKLQQILDEYIGSAEDTKDKLLGATFTLLNKNASLAPIGILFQGSAGHQAFAPDSPAYDINTVTWFASMTKVITATCLLQVVEKGKITLDEDIRPIVPELNKIQILRGLDESGELILEDNTAAITLRQLLTHTSGLPYDAAVPEIAIWSKAVGRQENRLSWTTEGFFTPLVFTPGGGWKYGTSLDWAARVLERVTGQRFSEYVEEHITAPLGMDSTTFYPKKRPADFQARLAEFPWRTAQSEGRLEPGPAPMPYQDEFEFESGGAGLHCTAADYAKFMQATIKGDVLLKPETTRLLFTPQLDSVQKADMVAAVKAIPLGYAPEYPPGLDIDFTFGGMINLEDIPGKRRKGSVMWSGYANSHWWCDFQTGISGILTTTVICDTVVDPIVVKLYNALEVQVYKQIEAGAHI